MANGKAFEVLDLLSAARQVKEVELGSEEIEIEEWFAVGEEMDAMSSNGTLIK